MIPLSNDWLVSISTCVGMTSEEVYDQIDKWWNEGCSIQEIESKLTALAAENNKVLIFTKSYAN